MIDNTFAKSVCESQIDVKDKFKIKALLWKELCWKFVEQRTPQGGGNRKCWYVINVAGSLFKKATEGVVTRTGLSSDSVSVGSSPASLILHL